MPTEVQEPTLLTINQAAEYCSVHANTIRNLINRGKLPAVRIGARIIRIKKAALEAVMTPYTAGEFGIWSR